MDTSHQNRPFLRPAKEISLELFHDPGWRASLGPVVLFTGSYDLLTPYHLQFLRTGKYLRPGLTSVVALDSDEAVRQIKGALRPILPYEVRRDSLAELTTVDWIIKHVECRNVNLIETVKPDILVMSRSTAQETPESRVEDIQAVESVGGSVVVLPTETTYHFPDGKPICTSGIVNSVISKYTSQTSSASSPQ